MHSTQQEKMEELAEEIWALAELGRNDLRRVAGGSKIPQAEAILDKMRRDGLVTFREGRDGKVELTPAGAEMARSIVRRHRLAEMLFSQVLALKEEISEATACRLEHILSTVVTDSVCAFLGHPPLCPHSKPIPRGRCCDLFSRDVKPIVTRMMDLPVGEACKVAFIRSPSADGRCGDGRLERLAALGLSPGATVRLKQKRPALVLDIGHTTVALDREVAREIYVQRLEPQAAGG